MNGKPNSPQIGGSLIVERAVSSKTGEIIGWRLSTNPPTKNVLVWADQSVRDGFCVGQGFGANYDEEIDYFPIDATDLRKA